MSTSAKAPPSGHFTILYFGPAEQHTSKTSEFLPAPLPISKLFSTLEEKYGGIKVNLLQSCLVTLNLEYVDVPQDDNDESGTVIKEGDEVAIIPPVSSG
jgi:molybdopterin converting factor small subunit